jgi:hypothetical protein
MWIYTRQSHSSSLNHILYAETLQTANHSSLQKITDRPWEDGNQLIGVRGEGITDALPHAVEAAQVLLSGTLSHCYPPVG